MKYPVATLQNLYYFLSEKTKGVVYEISATQDSDNCGVNPIKCDSDGNTDESANAAIFPGIKVTYKYDVIMMGKTEEKEVTKYYWLQNNIKDGDTFNGTKFTPMKHDSNKSTFIEQFLENVKTEMGRLAAGGASMDGVKSSLPYYLTIKPTDVTATSTVKIEGVYAKSLKVEPTEGASISTYILDSYDSAVEEYAKTQALKTANGIVAKIGKEYTNITLS